jgi:hypothetical protein
MNAASAWWIDLSQRVARQPDLPGSLADQRDPHRLTDDERLDDRRLLRRELAGEPRLVLAAVPVAPLRHAVALTRDRLPARQPRPRHPPEPRHLQRARQARQPQPTVEQPARARQARPAPQRQRRQEVEVVGENSMKHHAVDRQHPRPVDALDQQPPVLDPDLRQQRVADRRPREPPPQIDDLGLVEAHGQQARHDAPTLHELPLREDVRHQRHRRRVAARFAGSILSIVSAGLWCRSK